MGGLGHYLEREGIPTTQISLIREHTERIRPPRALWVPFDLGRPLGVPGDAAFQTRVLCAALELLEAPSGPVLVDFPDEAPDTTEPGVWACPVPLRDEAGDPDPGDVRAAFARELARLRPWYDLAVERRGRTTLGVSGLSPDELGAFLPRFLEQPPPPSPSSELALPMALKLAMEDLRALYGEAVTAQPGGKRPTAAEIASWFWDETAAGALLKQIRASLAASEDGGLRLVSQVMLVPADRA